MGHFISKIFILLTFVSFGQKVPFFDSLDFFMRTQTKQIDVKITKDGKLYRQLKCEFDKKVGSVTWCGKEQYGEFECGDKIYLKLVNKDTTNISGIITRFFFDNNGRLTKSTSMINNPDQAPQITSTTYYYVDNTTKRLQLILEELPFQYTLITYFYYDHLKLVKTVGIEIHTNNINKTTTYLYEYYPDKRLKTETITSTGDKTFIAEYEYKN